MAADSWDLEPRDRLRSLLQKNPGADAKWLEERMGCARSTLLHHVRVLQRQGVVHTARAHRTVHFFLGTPPRSRALLFPWTRPILEALDAHGHLNLKSLVKELRKRDLDVGIRTVRTHLERLGDDALVDDDGTYHRSYFLTDAGATLVRTTPTRQRTVDYGHSLTIAKQSFHQGPAARALKRILEEGRSYQAAAPVFERHLDAAAQSRAPRAREAFREVLSANGTTRRTVAVREAAPGATHETTHETASDAQTTLDARWD